MVTPADRARQKAEARRQRILARGAQRMDVVNGRAPSSREPRANSAALEGSSVGGGTIVDAAAPAAAEEAPAPDAAAVAAAPAAAAAESGEPAAAERAVAAAPASAGSRRMAAARRRRYVSKNKAKKEPEEGKGSVGSLASGVAKGEEKGGAQDDGENVAVASAVAETKIELKKLVSKSDATTDEPALVEAKQSTPATDQKETGPAEKDKENVTPSVVTPASTTTTTPSVKENKEDKPPPTKPKKYMGVARMRRKILKDQKAQRIKAIADAEVLSSSDTPPALEREIAAEMATMDVTASMARKGGMDLSGMLSVQRGMKKRWYAALVPPARTVPRLVTLLLLFFAGMDLGMQPHHGGHDSGDVASTSDAVGSMASRDLSGAGGSLIQHVEHSLTKPWEYGMGGKVAFMVGMAPSSPPTALPTSFNDAMVCTAAYGEDAEECLAAPDKIKRDARAKKDKGRKRKTSVIVESVEDAMDWSRMRPRGVEPRDDEFAENDPTLSKSGNVDPLFKVDLDILLQNANLPFPVDVTAKFAIGFHRAWIRYLWTLPKDAMKSLADNPKKLLGGWSSGPPWMLGVALLIRCVTRLLVGSGKTRPSLNPEGGGPIDGSGGGGKNLDILEKVVESAKNYATSTFPRTYFVVSTLLQVMKVDMYIMMCGMLIGLVAPVAREDILVWGGNSSWEGGWTRWPSLGQGEL